MRNLERYVPKGMTIELVDELVRTLHKSQCKDRGGYSYQRALESDVADLLRAVTKAGYKIVPIDA